MRAMTTVRSPSWMGFNSNLDIYQGEYTYQDEDPSPPFLSPYPVHKADAIRENSSKCAC